MKIVVLLSMFYLHVIDNFLLQGILANLKQKEWWKKNYPDKLYQYDYFISLFIHAFSWSFTIMIPILLMLYHKNTLNILSADIAIVIFANTAIYAYVDNLKANRRTISLIADQITHFMQILITFLYFN